MRLRQSALAATALLSMLAVSGAAVAQRGPGHFGGHGGGVFRGGHGGFHGGHGFGLGGAFIGGALVAGALFAPWYYPWPYYYSSYPTVIEYAPPAPTVYMEQAPAAQPIASDVGSWWYYCNDSRTYYPYVRECASPWQRVAPAHSVAR
jgi:hypothetical protein